MTNKRLRSQHVTQHRVRFWNTRRLTIPVLAWNWEFKLPRPLPTISSQSVKTSKGKRSLGWHRSRCGKNTRIKNSVAETGCGLNTTGNYSPSQANIDLLVLKPLMFFPCTQSGSRDGVIGIATGYGLDDRGVGVRVPVGSRICSSPRPLGPTQPPIQWASGALSPGVKWPGREADHSPQYGSIHPLPHMPPWRSA
jgi:hypothetical protein